MEPKANHERKTGSPISKKRVRPRAQRKRERTALEESGVSEDERHIGGYITKEVQRGPKKAWKREYYAADGKKVDYSDVATAERVDVGGESKPRAGPKKVFGPLRAPTHIRMSVRVDYQADICKDYKETGYCGFGDSCKFLHDRSDFRAGWKLDKDWAETEKLRREKVLRGEDPDAVDERENGESKDFDTDGLPFACHICRGEFKRPIVTFCEHYFCEDCALKRMEKDSTCAVCNKPLSGTLNPATKLEAKLHLKRGVEAQIVK